MSINENKRSEVVGMTGLLLAALSIIPQPKEVREMFGLVPVDTPVVVALAFETF